MPQSTSYQRQTYKHPPVFVGLLTLGVWETARQSEVSAGSYRRVYYIYTPAGLTAMYVKRPTTDSLYYLLTDHLGSITMVTRANGSVAETFSYDAWGRRRNPTDLSYNNVPLPRCTSRGYTGHEHLAGVNLINMNGRVYDPLMGMFLSPDPVLQSPNDPLNYNRYSYCVNNPLKYTDPDGELFFTWFVGFTKGFIKAAFDNRHEQGKHTWFGSAFKSANRHAMNKVKLALGMFTADTNRSGWGWQIVSKLTWELPQTLLGYGFGSTLNIFDQVNHVDISKYGVTVIDSDRLNGIGAVTIGSYIAGPHGFRADYHDHMFAHEFGHTRQSRLLGFFYLPFVGLPSLTSAVYDNKEGTNLHRGRWFETWANRYSINYFKRYSDFDINSFRTGDPSSYPNPRTLNINRDRYTTTTNWDWSDILINYPILNLSIFLSR